MAKRDLVVEEMEETAAKLRQEEDGEDFGRGKFSKYQKMLWDLIEKPDTSVPAKYISILSNICVAVSIIGMTMSTMPALQYEDDKGNMMESPILSLVETVCIAWFTLEYLIRLILDILNIQL